MKFDNRVTQMLGVEYPIVQAPMGWIARSALASAVSNAGGLGSLISIACHLIPLFSIIHPLIPIRANLPKMKPDRVILFLDPP